MLVKIKKNLDISPLLWYYRFSDRDVYIEVEEASPTTYTVKNWKQFVTPYELEHEGMSGLTIPKSHCEPVEYELASAKGNHLIFKKEGNPKPKHIFVVPEVNANTETTYVLSKINGKPMREVLLTLSYYGFDIYTKAGEEI